MSRIVRGLCAPEPSIGLDSESSLADATSYSVDRNQPQRDPPKLRRKHVTSSGFYFHGSYAMASLVLWLLIGIGGVGLGWIGYRLGFRAGQRAVRRSRDISLPLEQWAVYPTEAEWQQVLSVDPDHAIRLFHLLELQQAQYGSLHTPIALKNSLNTFRRLTNDDNFSTPSESV